jgi:CrcB protein
MILITLGVLGGVGAVARFTLDGLVAGRLGREFPFGTLVVNLLGAFLLGFLVGLAVDHSAYRLVGTGLIGAFSTFSTWTLESHRLGEDRRLHLGLVNFVASLMLGVAAAWAGRELGVAL